MWCHDALRQGVIATEAVAGHATDCVYVAEAILQLLVSPCMEINAAIARPGDFVFARCTILRQVRLFASRFPQQ